MLDMTNVEEMERRQRARWRTLITALVEAEEANGAKGAQSVVARRLGLSSSTVNQGMSGGRGFGPKVQAAMAAWGLRPDYFTAEGADDLDWRPFLSAQGSDPLHELTQAVREMQAKLERIDPDADVSRTRPKVK